MRSLRLATVLLLLIAPVQPLHAQPASMSLVDRAVAQAAAIRAKESLIRELGGMGAVDQEIRLRFLDLRKGATDEERRRLDGVWDRDYEPFDQAHMQRLKVLLAGRGWFAMSEVGERAATGAYSVVSHSSDLNFQKEALALMEALPPSERPGGYPNLWDRIAVSEKRAQRYGTQGTDCKDGEYVPPAALENPAELEMRRKEVGLPPMPEYLAVLQKMYGRCQALAR